MSRPGHRTLPLLALLVMGGVSLPAAAQPEDGAPPDGAQEEESDDGIDIGGYGGLGVRYARLLSRNTALACAEIAFMFEHALSIGSGACGTWLSADEVTEDADGLMLDFGGTVVRYHFMAGEPYDFSVGATAGAGSIEIEQSGDVKRTDSLIVLEPEAGGHTMVADWFRLSAVVAYRIVSGVDTGGVTSSDVSGLSFGVNAHFGWF